MTLQQSSDMEELLYLQTKCVAITIKGAAFHPSLPGISFQEKESNLSVICDETYEIFLAGNFENVSEQHLEHAHIGIYRLCPLFFEQQNYEIVIEPTEGYMAEFWHDNYNLRKRITSVGRRSSILSGMINFGNEIGMSDLIVLVDGKDYLKLTLEVFPTKISYKEDYQAIVYDVTKEVYNLVFDFLKKTYDDFDTSVYQKSSPVEFFAIIRKIYTKLFIAADLVLAKPHHILETEHAVLPERRVKRADNRTLRWMEKHPTHAVRSEKGILADRALAVRKYVTYDTKENRLIKYILQNTAKRLERFQKQYQKLSRNTDHVIIEQIDTMLQGINRRINGGFLKSIEAMPENFGMSLVFGMAPGYRELYRCYLLLQYGLSVTGSIFQVSIKDLAVLYEYWCFIKLNSLMKEKYRLLSQDIIKVNGKGLFISLVKGQQSSVRYLNPENGEIITLSYNPKVAEVPTVAQKPDNILKLEKKGARVSYEYVFDAKYRINAALEGSLYQLKYGAPGPQEEDINTMHRYRDAIVYQNQALPFERTMFGAYVLFPYHNEQEYQKHHFYQSIDQVNIGGLPFLPSATYLVEKLLDELIADSPTSAFERATLPLGIEERLAKVDWSHRDVLIGTVRSTKQYEVCKRKNFYYIPAKLVPDDKLPIHFVALYQTQRLFGYQAGIHYVGEVLRTALVKRQSIQEVPVKHGNPNELYYRFIIREWIPLTQPIFPKEEGFVNQFTNLFLLEHSEFVPELLLHSEEEYRFYTELKRRTNEAILNVDDSKVGFEIRDAKVLFHGGKIQLIREGRILEECGVEEFTKRPRSTFQRMLEKVKEMDEEG